MKFYGQPKCLACHRVSEVSFIAEENLRPSGETHAYTRVMVQCVCGWNGWVKLDGTAWHGMD